MSNLFQKKWIHIFIWIMMLIYVATAPTIYTRFILNEGKPAPVNENLPQPTDQISYSVDRLDFIKGQGLYNLWGWSFFRGDPDQAAYERWIVLQSDAQTYYYLSESFKRPELQSAFEDVNIDLTNAGYSAHISKYAIKPGTYKIGLLFKHKTSGELYFVVTNKLIIRTPNQIRMELSTP